MNPVKWVVLLAVACLGMAQVDAEQPAGRRIALVIGNGAYSGVAKLANPANDARLMAKTLQAAGFTLVGGGPALDLDKAHFDRLVQDFGRQLLGAEVALFYYSGHGMQVQGVNWLVPVDANPSSARDLDFQMVDANLVMRQMEDAGTKLNLLILDACRNNPFAVRGIRGSASGLAEMAVPEGTMISYATQPGNVALDGDSGDSPYTSALAQAIRSPGLDIFHVFNQVGLSVKQSTGGTQQPWLASSPIAGNFYFNGSAPAAVPATATAPPAAPLRNRFDGLWDVVLTCPTEGAAGGYTYAFTAQVTDDVMRGQHGMPGEPGSLTIEGRLGADGSAVLAVSLRTGAASRNVQAYKSAPPGTPYTYSAEAHFSETSGTGERLDGLRKCHYAFTKR